MPALLDSHAFLWLASDESRLSPAARAYVRDPSNELFLSAATGWELAIKINQGKLRLDAPFEALLVDVPRQLQLTWLGIEPGHLLRLATLPVHHRDPFDRLLVVQCLEEGWPIVSADAALESYGVERIW